MILLISLEHRPSPAAKKLQDKVIKTILALGLLANYALKFRPSVLRHLKNKKLDLKFSAFEIIVPGLAIIQLLLFVPKNVLTAYVGTSVFIFGVTLGIISRFQMQKNYLPALAATPSQEIVVRGLYRVIRHPIYLASILAIIGFEFIFHPIFAAVSLLVTPFLISQISKEEQMLLQRHGSNWLDYTKRTRFKLIPFIY